MTGEKAIRSMWFPWTHYLTRRSIDSFIFLFGTFRVATQLNRSKCAFPQFIRLHIPVHARHNLFLNIEFALSFDGDFCVLFCAVSTDFDRLRLLYIKREARGRLRVVVFFLSLSNSYETIAVFRSESIFTNWSHDSYFVVVPVADAV